MKDYKSDKRQSINNFADSILERIEYSPTKVSEMDSKAFNVDGCSCMGCGCFKSAWTVVLSPAGIAAGMAAAAAAAAL